MSREHIIIAGILICLFFGLFLRIYPLESQPYWMDEGYTINAILAYQTNPQAGLAATLDSGATYECFLYCKTTDYLTRVFDHSPTTYRAVAVFFGILSLLVIYAATKTAFNTIPAIFTTLLLTFSYLHIAWSTQARWYTMALTFTWMSFWYYLRFIQSHTTHHKKLLYGVATIVSVLLAIFSHKILLILPFLLLTHYLYVQYPANNYHKKVSPWFLLVLLGVGLCGWFLLQPRNLLDNISLQYNLPYYLGFLWNQYWLLIPLAIFSLTNRSPERWFFAWIFIGFLTPLAFCTDIVQYRYIFMVTPIIFILAVLGAIDLYQLTVNKIPHKKTYASVIVLFIFSIFILSPAGTIIPQHRYWLESDPSPHIFTTAPSTVYTPQPNWNDAYAFISKHQTPDTVVISSHPQFTKIFLGTAGYWLSIDYLGFDDHKQFRTTDKREYYVGALSIDTLSSLKTITTDNDGFLIFDYMTQDGRITPETLNFITKELTLVYHKKDAEYSEIWIYQF